MEKTYKIVMRSDLRLWREKNLCCPSTLKRLLWDTYKGLGVAKDDRKFIFRFDSDETTGKCVLKVICRDIKPNLDSLTDLAEKFVVEEVGFDNLHPGLWVFATRCSPVKNNDEGKEVPRETLADVTEWIKARFTKAGDLVAVEILNSPPPLQFMHKGNPVTKNVADLKRTVDVKKTDEFKHLLRFGVGGGKAFGLGLLDAFPIIT